MLLRNSISNTKKFFQRTLGGLKSFFSGGSYQKLPKSPLNNPNSYSTTTTTCALDMNIQQSKGLDKLNYADFTHQWAGSGDIDRKASKRINRVKIIPTSSKGDHHKNQDGDDNDPIESKNKLSAANSNAAKKIKKSGIMERREHQTYPSKVVIVKRKEDCSSLMNNQCEEYSHHEEGFTRNFALVEKKLKELELLDTSNVDHALDIEEVLHYYSRLTCPAYLEIVDKFFVEIFSEFFGSSTPIRSINSRLRPTSVMIK